MGSDVSVEVKKVRILFRCATPLFDDFGFVWILSSGYQTLLARTGSILAVIAAGWLFEQ